jgi:hypothetical protein
VMSSAQMLGQLFADMHLPADLLKVLGVFLAASLFFVVVFSAQLCLIFQIEQGHLLRRFRQRSKLDKGSLSRNSPAKSTYQRQDE